MRNQEPELTWNVAGYRFELWPQHRGHSAVKVFPPDGESFWMETCGGEFETESGAAYAILRFLEDEAVAS